MSWRRILWATGLLWAWALMVWNDWNPMLRLDSPTLNAICLLAAYTLPWLAMLLVVPGSKGVGRIIAVAILSLPLLFTAVMGVVVFLHLADVRAHGDRDASFALIGAVPVDGGRVAIYRTNCGATCGYGIAVRQERRVVWRFVLVRHLGDFYRADDARYDAVGPRRVRVAVPPYVRTPGNETRAGVYVVKPWVYF